MALQEETLAKLLENSYGISAATIAKKPEGLNGLTFSVKADDKQYALQILPSSYSQKQADAETSLISFLAERNFPAPKIVANSEGRLFAEFGEGEQQRYVRLEEVIEGQQLDDALSTEISANLGDLAGRLVSALSEFHHPYYDSLPDPHFLLNSTIDDIQPWDVLSDTKGERPKQLIHDYFQLYREKISSHMEHHSVQQIHNNLYGVSILTNNKEVICGLDNFTDSRRTLRIIEPATTLFGILAFGKNKLEAAEAFMKAFLQHVNLSKQERAAIPITIAGVIVRATIIHNHLKAVDTNYCPGKYFERLYAVSWDIVADLLNTNSVENKLFSTFF